MGHNTPSTIAPGAKYQTARDIPYGHGEINQMSQLTVSPLNLANPTSPNKYINFLLWPYLAITLW